MNERDRQLTQLQETGEVVIQRGPNEELHDVVQIATELICDLALRAVVTPTDDGVIVRAWQEGDPSPFDVYDPLIRIGADALDRRLGGKAGFLFYGECMHHASIVVPAIIEELEGHAVIDGEVVKLERNAPEVAEALGARPSWSVVEP